MTQIWLDVTTAAGTAYGAGPITTATEWRQRRVLDKAGEFSFSMPASDPQAALLANRRYVHCYGVVDDAVTELGSGIIDRIETRVEDPAVLQVSGPDLLAELGARIIPELTVCGKALIDLTLNADTGYWRGSARWISNRYGVTFDVDLPDAHDGTTDTGGETITLWSEGDPNIEYLYVGCDARFDYVTVTISDTYLEKNRAETTLAGQYFDGDGWVTLPDLVDGTSEEDMGHLCTMFKTGNITFTRPDDWARVEPTAAAGSWFWVRFTVGAGTATDAFLLREVQVYGDVPTTDGVNSIMAYAPDGWTKTGYAATTSVKYLELQRESVLAALRALSEQGGQDGGGDPVREHFTLGTGREINWIATFTDSGVRAGQGTAPTAGTCLIRSLRRAADTSETVTRVYPASNDGITLHLTTRTPPATYTLSTTDGYLQNDTGSSLYGRIDAAPIFTDIQSQQSDSWYEHPAMVANALYDRSLEYLRTHGTAQDFYDLEVVGAPATLAPGQTIVVAYHEYVDAYHAVNIDDTLYILETETQIDSTGLRTVALEVATVDRLPETSVGVIVAAVRDVRRVSSGANTTIIAVGETSAAEGASFPGTCTLATVNTDDGSEHFHYLNLTAHTGDANAHHNAVTVGNTGLALSTQELSLNLAATSGLAISSGLLIDDAVAGAGLTMTSKVLAVGQGDGIAVSANAVAVDATVVRTSRNLIAGAGLTGGGTLAADRTFAVGQGDGLTVDADAVALTTPGSLSVSSPNAAAGNHTHAITSNANPGAAASILASDASGYLGLTKLTTPLLDTASGNMEITPAGDLILDPVGNDVLPETGYDLNLGSLAKKYLTLHAAELWVETLVAQETIATIGGRILVGPTTTLTSDLAADVDINFPTFKHNEAAYDDTLYMEANGSVEFMWVRWGTINAVNTGAKSFRLAGDYAALLTDGTKFTVAGSTGNDGEYTANGDATYSDPNTTVVVDEVIPDATADGGVLYTGAQGTGPYTYLQVTRNRDGTGANAWHAGDAVFNTGAVGDGFMDLYSVHGVKASSEYGPSIVGNVRTSTIYNAWSPHWAIGNLNGVYGYSATTFGFAAGKYADDYSFLTVDATNGVRMLKRAASADTVLAQWAVDGVLTIGEVAAGKSNMQISAGAFALRLNTTALITADTSGNLTLGQVATNQGNAYWNASTKQLQFRGGANGTQVGAWISTSGAFVAGPGGNVKLDGDGLQVEPYNSDIAEYSSNNAIRFVAVPGDCGGLYGVYDIGDLAYHQIGLIVPSISGSTSAVEVEADSDADPAAVTISAISGTGSVAYAQIEMVAETGVGASIELSGGPVTLTSCGLNINTSGAASGELNAAGKGTFGGIVTAAGVVCPYQSELTLDAAGAITVGGGTFYRVDTYEDAASDDLVTINGGADGKIITLRIAAGARDVVVKNGTGNIYCGGDLTMSVEVDRITLQYDSNLAVWVMLSWANNA